MNDTGWLLLGTIGATIMAQIGGDLNMSDLMKGLTANGVLAFTFYLVMWRFERRLDDAFKVHQELTGRLLNLLQKDENE